MSSREMPDSNPDKMALIFKYMINQAVVRLIQSDEFAWFSTGLCGF
jgi:hypothetical protein